LLRQVPVLPNSSRDLLTAAVVDRRDQFSTSSKIRHHHEGALGALARSGRRIQSASKPVAKRGAHAATSQTWVRQLWHGLDHALSVVSLFARLQRAVGIAISTARQFFECARPQLALLSPAQCIGRTDVVHETDDAENGITKEKKHGSEQLLETLIGPGWASSWAVVWSLASWRPQNREILEQLIERFAGQEKGSRALASSC
jgi:hypothetical protein